MNISQITNENAEDLNIGDPVIITGNVQFKGKTGDIVDFGKDKRFVIVNLYNYGKHSFHSSDVSYNDYAESGDEQERMSQYESKASTKFAGKWKGTDDASKAKERLVGEAKSLQSKFEKHLAKHGYDVAEKSKYWEKKLKDIDAQIAAWDAEMAARKQNKGVAEDSVKDVTHGDHPRATDVPVDRLVNLAQAKGPLKGREAYVRFSGPVTHSPNAEDSFVRGVIFDREQESGGKRLVYWLKDDAGRNMTATARDIFVVEQGVAEASNDYFKRRKDEEDRIAGIKAPAKRKPAQSDYSKRRAQEKKVEQGVAEGAYDDPRWEEEPHYKRFDPDAWKELRDREEEEAAMSQGKPSTVTVRDAEGNVVLQFPSTGGYYGDVRTAKAKGFDTEAGDYDIKWQKNEDAMMSEDTGATSEQVAAEIVRRIIFKHKDAISTFGPEAIMAAAREVGEFFAGAEELGTSDIGIATKYTLEKLDQMSRGALGESASAGATGAGNIATNLTGGAGKNVGSLFGGSYKQKRTKKSPGTK